MFLALGTLVTEDVIVMNNINKFINKVNLGKYPGKFPFYPVLLVCIKIFRTTQHVKKNIHVFGGFTRLQSVSQ